MCFRCYCCDGPDATLVLHAKPVRWITNSRLLKEILGLRFANYPRPKGQWHDHGKVGCKAYPPRLVAAILAAVRQELMLSNSMHWLAAGQHIDERDEWQTHADYLEIYDAITGVHLDPAFVSAGRTEELTSLKQLGAYKYDTILNCKAATGKPPVPTGWIDVNKGDVTTPLVCCRWVIKETRHNTSTDTSDPSQPLGDATLWGVTFPHLYDDDTT